MSSPNNVLQHTQMQPVRLSRKTTLASATFGHVALAESVHINYPNSSAFNIIVLESAKGKANVQL